MMSEKPSCYCGISDMSNEDVLRCEHCKKEFHMDCLRSKPSGLKGDIFYNLVCESCGQSGEEVTRIKLSWLQIIMLALYNIQLSSAGKKGYFHWREHVTQFIDKHWNVFFGASRKKSTNWHGTVAGTLSTGCPEFFRSGMAELNESGWWALRENKPPALNTKSRSRTQTDIPREQTEKHEGLRKRHRGTSLLDAAVKLKEKRTAAIKGNKELKMAKIAKLSEGSESKEMPTAVIKQEEDVKECTTSASNTLGNLDCGLSDSQHSFGASSHHSSESYLTEKSLCTGATVPDLFMKDDSVDDDSDFEIDPGSFTPPHTTDFTPPTQSMPEMEEIMASLPASDTTDVKDTPTESIKSEGSDNDADSEESTSDNEDGAETTETAAVKSAKGECNEHVKEEEHPVVQYAPMSLYEERKVLKMLLSLSEKMLLPTKANRLKRKLIVRSIKRERGLPCFDLDAEVRRVCPQSDGARFVSFPQNGKDGYHVLDRFQTPSFSLKSYRKTSVSFLNRLVGTEDDQLQSICSPYTARILKPFIRRDYESRPLKMKLLQDIVSHYHRADADWTPPPSIPIDYCYVRPQHVPSVNALCREFFWPGIDLSECLQYPDFSCVVLYRKVVIGFAFMVPDVKYNEAYISFLFTHPEWRGAGIGSFVLYHLIQTCMGKDVTLHVSASNPAMMMYQKFGFKAEEYILDFYDKYYPEHSQECKHAFLMRLKR